jgi:DNA-directed RNA polymerase specialized sigma24 family protein
MARIASSASHRRDDSDLRQGAILKVLSGAAADHSRPWPVWKLYFSAAVDRLGASLHRRRIVQQRAEPVLRRRAAAAQLAPATESVLLRREASVRVVAVFQALSKRMREVLLRRDCLRQSVGETARALFGSDHPAARNATTQAHRRASAAFLVKLTEAFGEPKNELLRLLDSEFLREAMLAVAVREGLLAESPPTATEASGHG